LNSFRCIDFDMRVYGKSERPFQPYDMEVWADDLAGLMDHLGLRSAHIHGTSMGGMVRSSSPQNIRNALSV
jgi:pimeloyl-ACP methyl ester carboxylesterase